MIMPNDKMGEDKDALLQEDDYIPNVDYDYNRVGEPAYMQHIIKSSGIVICFELWKGNRNAALRDDEHKMYNVVPKNKHSKQGVGIKWSDMELRDVFMLLTYGVPISEVARCYGVDRTVIKHIMKIAYDDGVVSYNPCELELH